MSTHSGSDGPATTGTFDEYIAAWEPTFDADGEVIAHARRTVTAARPRNKKEAGNALRWCSQYGQWRTTNGYPLDNGDMFARDTVDKFLADEYGMSPKGTVDAIRSNLCRLAPGAGFAHTTRKPATNPHSATGNDNAAHTAATNTAVAAQIDSYVPSRLDPARWHAVAPVVRAAVTAADTGDPQRAADLIRHGAYLAAWVHHTRELPVRTDTVFAARTIEAFITMIADNLPAGSVRTFAANLHHLRGALRLPLDVERRRFGRDTPKRPYTPTELASLDRRIVTIPTRARRRYVRTGIDLVVGCGVTGADAGRIRPDQITADDGTVTLAYVPGVDVGDPTVDVDDELGIRPATRRVRALPGYADRLAAARDAAVEAGDEYLLGGTCARRKRLSNVLKPHAVQHAIAFDALRGRLTWAVEVGQIVCEHVGGVDSLRQLIRRDAVMELLEDAEL